MLLLAFESFPPTHKDDMYEGAKSTGAKSIGAKAGAPLLSFIAAERSIEGSRLVVKSSVTTQFVRTTIHHDHWLSEH
jgi:hypothetical protein